MRRGLYRGAILAALLVPAALVGAEPAPAPSLKAAPVDAAAPVLVGEKSAPWLIELKAKNTPPAKSLRWEIHTKNRDGDYVRAVGKVQTRVILTEKAFLFSGPAGDYLVVCSYDDGKQFVELEWAGTLTGGVAPGPTPPGPNPPAPQPDGKLGLVKASRDGFAKVAAGREKAPELAKAQRAHASAVAAGAFGNDAPRILAGWRDSNKAAVDATQWAEWGRAVSSKLAELHAAGKLTTAADWAAAFEEVAQGLGG